MSAYSANRQGRTGVVGCPVAHSRSPLIHEYWLERYGLEGSYERIELFPDDLDNFLKTFMKSGYIGCNVTVPYKERVFHLVDKRDETALRVGAVNTIWVEDGRLCGGNTDLYGFLANLDEGSTDWAMHPGKAVVLGAGGAARAVLAALSMRNFAPIFIVNRNLERAYALIDALDMEATVIGWDEAAGILSGARLLVNTTTLGMKGSDPLSLCLNELPRDALVSDIVYVPLLTDLLRAARLRGNPVRDGLGMLMYQAVPGFERWFGVRPVVDTVLRRLLLRDLGEAEC